MYVSSSMEPIRRRSFFAVPATMPAEGRARGTVATSHELSVVVRRPLLDAEWRGPFVVEHRHRRNSITPPRVRETDEEVLHGEDGHADGCSWNVGELGEDGFLHCAWVDAGAVITSAVARRRFSSSTMACAQ